MDMKYRVVVVGGGPSGSCAAEEFAKDKNLEVVLLERKLDNCKPCGGAIPLCMVSEFDLPAEIIDRKVSLSSQGRGCYRMYGEVVPRDCWIFHRPDIPYPWAHVLWSCTSISMTSSDRTYCFA